MNRKTYEANFDGLVGPTHNYSGLSFGNIASMNHQSLVSNPKEAALQGLAKMRFLSNLGFKQGVLPPQERPHQDILKQIKLTPQANDIFYACCSASSMWTANAATVSPSEDSLDQKVHFTPANLISKFHRSIETSATSQILKSIFPDERYFVHHEALPPNLLFADEGAANHTRFCTEHGAPGLQLFVYGINGSKYPARQSKSACEALIRLHELDFQRVVVAQQNPEAIDAGVFHNDVISVGNCHVFLVHQEAFMNQDDVLRELQQKFMQLNQGRILTILEVPSAEVSLQDAVSSYLFNSQLLSLSNSKMLLLAPKECEEVSSVKNYLDKLLQQDSPIERIEYFDLKQSMRNGGGPACLRLRIVLSDEELSAVHPGVWLTPELDQQLVTWVNKHYRDRLSTEDLLDPELWKESSNALAQLMAIMAISAR